VVDAGGEALMSASREEWGRARSAPWGSTHDEAAEPADGGRAGAKEQQ
jgi:hypothetical protein